jgi:hypothetical protein
MSRVGAFAVWYYHIIVRGPFATKERARKAMAKVKKDSSCVHERLRVGKYDKAADAQDPQGHWTHPSVLLLRRPQGEQERG